MCCRASGRLRPMRLDNHLNRGTRTSFALVPRSVMVRDAAFHTFLTARCAVLFLAPPALGWRGIIDCSRHCRLRLAQGAHCPVTYASHPRPSSHDCHAQRSVKSHRELRCACPLSSSAAPLNLEAARFLLPQNVVVAAVLVSRLQQVEFVSGPLETSFLPPDPPPGYPALFLRKFRSSGVIAPFSLRRGRMMPRFYI